MNELFSWAVVVPALIALVTLGFGVLTLPKRPEHQIAKGCFWAAAVYAWLKVIMWAIATSHGATFRLSVVVASLVLISVLLIEGVRIIEERKRGDDATSKTLITAPLQSSPIASPSPDGTLSDTQQRKDKAYRDLNLKDDPK